MNESLSMNIITALPNTEAFPNEKQCYSYGREDIVMGVLGMNVEPQMDLPLAWLSKCKSNILSQYPGDVLHSRKAYYSGIMGRLMRRLLCMAHAKRRTVTATCAGTTPLDSTNLKVLPKHFVIVGIVPKGRLAGLSSCCQAMRYCNTAPDFRHTRTRTRGAPPKSKTIRTPVRTSPLNPPRATGAP
jgi:hypothetical protein